MLPNVKTMSDRIILIYYYLIDSKDSIHIILMYRMGEQVASTLYQYDVLEIYRVYLKLSSLIMRGFKIWSNTPLPHKDSGIKSLDQSNGSRY